MIFLQLQISSHLNLTRDKIDGTTRVEVTRMTNMVEAEATGKGKDTIVTNLHDAKSVNNMVTAAGNVGSDILPTIPHMLTTIHHLLQFLTTTPTILPKPM